MLSAGEIVNNRFLIRELIGQGTSAFVYLADEVSFPLATSASGPVSRSNYKVLRTVALKVVYHSTSGPTNSDLFLEEARRLATLNHPHIIHLYDYFQMENHFDCMVMEYAEGGTLADLLDEKRKAGLRFSLAQAQSYFLQMSEAVVYAHQRQILHHNLKPQNMLFMQGRLVVGDFGFSKVLANSETTVTDISNELYMPPEKWAGQMDLAGNVYTLGIILYELLAGEPPFNAHSSQHLQALHFNQPLPNILDLRPDLPPTLQPFLLKLTAKNPAERPPANQIKSMVESALAGQEITSIANSLSGGPVPSQPVSPSQNKPLVSPQHSRHSRSWKLSQMLAILLPSLILIGVVVSVFIILSSSQENINSASTTGGPTQISGKLLYSLQTPTTVYSVAFSADGKILLSGDAGAVRLWDVTSGQELSNLPNVIDKISYPANLAVFSPDSTTIGVSSFGYYRFRLLNSANLTTLLSLRAYPVIFSPDGKLLAGVVSTPDPTLPQDDKTIKLWDATTGKEVKSFKTTTDDLNLLAYSPDGQLIVSTSSYEHRLKVWDTKSGNELRTIPLQTTHISSIAFSPDGKWLVSGSVDQNIKLWQVSNGLEIFSIKSDTQVSSVTFSPNGRIIASGNNYGNIELWDADNRIQLLAFHSQNAPISSLAFSPDGKILASASEDRSIKLWQI